MPSPSPPKAQAGNVTWPDLNDKSDPGKDGMGGGRVVGLQNGQRLCNVEYFITVSGDQPPPGEARVVTRPARRVSTYPVHLLVDLLPDQRRYTRSDSLDRPPDLVARGRRGGHRIGPRVPVGRELRGPPPPRRRGPVCARDR